MQGTCIKINCVQYFYTSHTNKKNKKKKKIHKWYLKISALGNCTNPLCNVNQQMETFQINVSILCIFYMFQT